MEQNKVEIRKNGFIHFIPANFSKSAMPVQK